MWYHVVYHPFPTSNHNGSHQAFVALMLYIILFLHQTTTVSKISKSVNSCISSFSYIKPQLGQLCDMRLRVVYHPFPTSNHNWVCLAVKLGIVVYHPFPTSNHNCGDWQIKSWLLYIILFLHQTTTLDRPHGLRSSLYIILFLHQTTTRWFLPLRH